jgi:hypothetical protein
VKKKMLSKSFNSEAFCLRVGSMDAIFLGDSNDTGMKVDGYRILRLNSDQCVIMFCNVAVTRVKPLREHPALSADP